MSVLASESSSDKSPISIETVVPPCGIDALLYISAIAPCGTADSPASIAAPSCVAACGALTPPCGATAPTTVPAAAAAAFNTGASAATAGSPLAGDASSSSSPSDISVSSIEMAPDAQRSTPMGAEGGKTRPSPKGEPCVPRSPSALVWATKRLGARRGVSTLGLASAKQSAEASWATAACGWGSIGLAGPEQKSAGLGSTAAAPGWTRRAMSACASGRVASEWANFASGCPRSASEGARPAPGLASSCSMSGGSEGFRQLRRPLPRLFSQQTASSEPRAEWTSHTEAGWPATALSCAPRTRAAAARDGCSGCGGIRCAGACVSSAAGCTR
eukprot:scaffold4145_cov115-Isochrysis_galbana.AAC.9